jgi:hypothetical protein
VSNHTWLAVGSHYGRQLLDPDPDELSGVCCQTPSSQRLPLGRARLYLKPSVESRIGGAAPMIRQTTHRHLVCEQHPYGRGLRPLRTWLPIVSIRFHFYHTHDFRRGVGRPFQGADGRNGLTRCPGNLTMSQGTKKSLTKARLFSVLLNHLCSHQCN